MASYLIHTTETIEKTFLVWALDEQEAIREASRVAKDIHTDRDKYTVRAELVEKIGNV